MHINNTVIEVFLDTGVDVSIVTPESWHPNWPQQADVQFLGIGTLPQVKQITRWVECIGPEKNGVLYSREPAGSWSQVAPNGLLSLLRLQEHWHSFTDQADLAQ